MFNSLPTAAGTRKTWWISLVVHGLVLAVVVVAPLVFPDHLRLTNNLEPVYNITALVSPPKLTAPIVRPPVPAPKALAAPPRELALRDERVVLPPIVEERKESPRLPEPVKLEPVFPEASAAAPAPPKAPAPPRNVVTGVLSSDSAEAPKPAKPAREVQTGGFGDPNGARGEGRPDRPANIASLGSFDLPTGPGVGNGTGGSRGARGAVALAGFGGGGASSNGSGTGQAGRGGTGVRQGGFNDARPDQNAGIAPVRESAPKETPAEILSKPRPEYTEAARKARIEGEVSLRVQFSATGDIRVLDVVKGLPHGLNESATRAAEQIRFKPATKDGRPVDSFAVVHIIFQLAY
jgi:TonB family protein